ncbi:MAG: serine/threonine-protein kinase [Rhodothermales bacterium]
MDAARWTRIEALFDHAAALEPDARAAFLDAETADDPALREEVEALLAADADADDYLGRLNLKFVGPALESALAQRDALIGSEVGPYRVLRMLGQGGMGAVYLAERADGAFAQTVALKLVRPGLAPDLTTRFLAERRILARLEHPNIARLIDGGVTADGRPWLAMEYAAGEPITDYCDRKQLSVNERLALFEEVCEAVTFAHRNLVVHRDLKPSNILVAESGSGSTVKLLDFGIAKLMEDDDAFAVAETRTGMRVMTPEYAAPEQVRGEPVSTATDVYALGVLLYELLTGRRPYRLASRVRHEVERAILEDEPTRPSTAVGEPLPETERTTTPDTLSQARRADTAALRRRLSGDLDQIVLTALRKEPDRRYGSAEAFADDVRRHLHGQPVKAQPDTAGYRARKFVRRHRGSVAAAALVFVALAAGLGTALWQADRAEAEAVRAQTEAAKAREVTTFLIDLFETNNPNESRGDAIPVRDVLERGAVRVLEDLDGEPDVQAALLSAIGEVYRKLGNYERADSLLRIAVASRRTLAASDPDVRRGLGESLLYLGSVRREEGAYAEALTLVREADSLTTLVLGPRHPTTLAVRNELAMVLQQNGQPDQAAALLREIIAVGEEELDPDGDELATYRVNLGGMLAEVGELDEARPPLEQGIRTFRTVFGPDDPRTVAATSSLAYVLKSTGAFNEAEEAYRQVIASLAVSYGPKHPAVSFVTNNLASLLKERGEYDEADSLYTRAVTNIREAMGPEHPAVLVLEFNRADLARRRGDLDAAETGHRAVLEARQRVLGPDHPDVAGSYYEIAQLHLAREDAEGAEPLLRQAIAIYEPQMGTDNVATAEAYRALGELLSRRGSYAEADPLLLSAHETFLLKRGRDHEETREAASTLSTHYRRWNKPEDAARYQPMAAE